MKKKKFWWEDEFLSAKNGKLYLGEEEATKIAQDYGTPLYVYSKKKIISNYQITLNAFQKKTPLEIRVCYAMKANENPKILEILRGEGAWIDAVSPSEVDRALDADFPGKKILFTGTSVSKKDLQHVFRYDGVVVNIDAEEQLDLMKEVKEKLFTNKIIDVSIRWNPGIGRGFSPKAITAGKESLDGTPVKFGIEDKKVISTFKKAAEFGFAPNALHQHLGSGWVREDFEAVKHAVDKMIKKVSELQKHGFKLEFIDFGGGFGPRYSYDQEVFPLNRYAEYITSKIEQANLNIKAIALEPGKHLVGNAGVLLLKVEYIKKSYRNIFACVNGGTFNTAPRPAIYTQAHHHIINCTNIQSDRMEKITVAGNLCETGDIFGNKIPMPLPQRGDILALLCAGAYCRSMASNFTLREIPKEIII